MEFLKISGSGNDFVVVDNRRGAVRDAAGTARRLCDRKAGVGADGLLLLGRSRKADFTMRVINADGSEAEMCGNGLRCIVRFIRELGISRREDLAIETLAGVYETRARGRTVRVRMLLPEEPGPSVRLALPGGAVTGFPVNTGVPHFVVFVRRVAAVDVAGIGPLIRRHGRFAPAGTNVDWVAVADGRTLRVRTYERGVEAETLACGTGMTASALVARRLGRVGETVTVIPASGERLRASFPPEPGVLFLEGGTSVPFSGRWRGE